MSAVDPKELREQVHASVGRAVVGLAPVIDHLLIAVVAGGHVLLEGPPGTAKTLLARSFAATLGFGFNRVQFTPDLMPGDVLGTNLFDFRTATFILQKGPVFTEFLLADEINRTPPRTQAALLQAMQERSVTLDGTTFELSPCFTVVATQNPIEQQGTYPLPEAQLDRFLFKILLDAPSREDEVRIVAEHGLAVAQADPQSFGIVSVTDIGAILALRDRAGAVRVAEPLFGYAVDLVRATRRGSGVLAGASPRAAAALVAAGRARAVLDGRDYLLPDDLQVLAPALLRHRIVLGAEAEIAGERTDAMIGRILQSVPAPR